MDSGDKRIDRSFGASKFRYKQAKWIIVCSSALVFAAFYFLGGLGQTVDDVYKHVEKEHPASEALVPNVMPIDSEIYRAAKLQDPQELIGQLEASIAAKTFANQDTSNVPQYIHQSWVDQDVPKRFLSWRRSWRVQNPDWSYVLWTDHDNRELIRRIFPWFLEVYDSLPAPIMRADISRNFYMFGFGGIYADLDTECLRPFKYLFEGIGGESDNKTADKGLHAFVGRMGKDYDFPHSIPNAWMASSQGHPLWMLPIIQMIERRKVEDYKKWRAEDASGPVALKRSVDLYHKKYAHKYGDLFAHISEELPGLASMLDHMPPEAHSVEILREDVIYPLDWHENTLSAICWANSETFDGDLCNQHFIGSFMVTYWSHSWNDEPEGKAHDAESLSRLKNHA